MRYPKTIRPVSVLFLLIFLVVCGGLIAFSAPTAVTAEHPAAGGPVRLRLKVDQTTLGSNQATKMWAEFLDGDYNKVANDGTRDVRFEVEPRDGSISPPTVQVKPGEWSSAPPYATFAPRRQGRVLIRVSSAGLDSDETFVLVTEPAASFLSQILALFEPVTYAQDVSQKIEILPKKPFKNSVGSQVKFQVSFSGALPADAKIAISTDPSATIHYHGKDFDRVTQIDVKEIASGKDGGMSDSISITSERVGDVEVSAVVDSNGLRASETATFSPPSPSRVLFDNRFREVPFTHTTIPISIQLADEREHPIQSDIKRSVDFRLANEDDPVDFEHRSVVFEPNQPSAGTMLRLKGLPRENPLTLYAVSHEDGVIRGHTTIFIKGPIEVMLYWLVFAALGGGLIGGVVRHIPKDYKLQQVLPKWTGECLDLGLVGRIVGSVVCGLFLYLTMKLGVARMIGSPVLPAGIDLGTKLVAFFFGGIGGFAGTVVFDRLVSWCLPNPQSVKTALVAPAVNNPAQP